MVIYTCALGKQKQEGSRFGADLSYRASYRAPPGLSVSKTTEVKEKKKRKC